MGKVLVMTLTNPIHFSTPEFLQESKKIRHHSTCTFSADILVKKHMSYEQILTIIFLEQKILLFERGMEIFIKYRII